MMKQKQRQMIDPYLTHTKNSQKGLKTFTKHEYTNSTYENKNMHR